MNGARRLPGWSAVAQAVFGMLLVSEASLVVAEPMSWAPAERRAILAHGPWPPTRVPDTSNRFSGDPRAIEAGRKLFVERGLSSTGTVACVDCHRPDLGFTDRRPVAVGAARHHRHTQSLHDLAGQRWFGWDGGADSLWSAALRPLFSPIEMAASESAVAELVRARAQFEFLHRDAGSDRAVAVNVGKAIAAWVETLQSPRTPFDDYRDALARGDTSAMAAYPRPAARGLRLFIGRGRCNACHVGPRFTNDEFHDIGRPFFYGKGRVDAGRQTGIRRVTKDPFNLLGPFNDASEGPGDQRWKTAGIFTARQFFGAWKTPTLRGLTHTPPYTHDGSLDSLDDVVLHYSEFDPQRIHNDGQALLQPLKLGARERADLVEFLRTLSASRIVEERRTR